MNQRIVLACMVVAMVVVLPMVSGYETGELYDQGVGDNLPVKEMCSGLRWKVKTTTDNLAVFINQTLAETGISRLRRMIPPAGIVWAARTFPVEFTIFNLTANMTAYKAQKDGDYSIILSDQEGFRMIAEIPAPGCVQQSLFLSQIKTARQALDQKVTPTNHWQLCNMVVQVSGVGFFGIPSWEKGMAPNGIQLHPVVDIQFLM